MEIQELKNKIIAAIELIDDDIKLLEILKFIKSHKEPQDLVHEPEISYQRKNSIKTATNGIPESYYSILDQERQELIDHPELSIEWSAAKKIIFEK